MRPAIVTKRSENVHSNAHPNGSTRLSDHRVACAKYRSKSSSELAKVGWRIIVNETKPYYLTILHDGEGPGAAISYDGSRALIRP
jgi:hypothetical protein